VKRKLILTSAIIAITALTIVPIVHAGPGRQMRGEGGGEGMGRGHRGFGIAAFAHLGMLREKLDLSDQQVDQLKAIFAEVHQQNTQAREQFHGGLKDAAEVLLANPNDIAGAQAVLDQQADAEKALKSNLLQATSKALNVLTPDQRAKLTTIIEERASRREARKR
jgi:Spy/CpxP family protein refolding chaperone